MRKNKEHVVQDDAKEAAKLRESILSELDSGTLILGSPRWGKLIQKYTNLIVYSALLNFFSKKQP